MSAPRREDLGSPAPLLSTRFDDALVFASDLHRYQLRKGTPVPYMSHLMAVCAIVLENGGDEDEAIAALLHDAAEDQGGEPTLRAIAERFGERVGDIVAACSDTFERPKPPALERKRAYLARLDSDSTPRSVLLVSAGDKVHNLQRTIADYTAVGEELWSRFKLRPAEQLWYYQSLAEVYSRRLPGPLAQAVASLANDLGDVVTASEGVVESEAPTT